MNTGKHSLYVAWIFVALALIHFVPGTGLLVAELQKGRAFSGLFIFHFYFGVMMVGISLVYFWIARLYFKTASGKLLFPGRVAVFFVMVFGFPYGTVAGAYALYVRNRHMLHSTTKTHRPSEPGLERQIEAGPPICPSCGVELLQMTCGDLVLDVCQNGCGGVWFDNFEFRQATESIRCIEEDWLPRTTTDHSIHVDPSAKRPCPKCDGIRMLRHWFSDSCHIEIDECPSCGGIWLDAGAFEQIHASVAPKDAGSPRSTPDPETAILMSCLETEMEQSRQQTQARRGLCKFIGRRYCTPYRNCEL